MPGNDSYTKLLLHCNGTDGSLVITDSSLTLKGNARIPIGPAQLDTAQQKFGTASLLLNGSTSIDYVDSTDWTFGTDDFTLDFWVMHSTSLAVTGCFLNQYVGVNDRWRFQRNASSVGNQLVFIAVYGGVVKAQYSTDAWSPVLGQWYHFALVRNGTNVFIFIDGVSQTLTVSTAISTNSLSDLASRLNIGRQGDNTFGVVGWMDEIRVSKGIARWTTNFTPPTLEYAQVITTSKLSDTAIYGTTVQTILSDSYIVNTEVETLNSDTNIFGTTTKSVLSQASVFSTTEQAILSDTRVVYTEVETLNSDATIFGTTSKDILSQTDIFSTSEKSILADTKIISSVVRTVTSDTDILTIATKEINSDSRIVLTQTKTIDSNTIIFKPIDLICTVSFTKSSQKDLYLESEIIQVTPTAPSNVLIANVGSGDAVRISWSGTSLFYNVYLVTTGPVYTKMNAYLISDHFYVVGGLQEGFEYTFIVRGADGQG